MHALTLAPQTATPAPQPGQGPDRTDHAATRLAEPVKAAETARPVTAPEKPDLPPRADAAPRLAQPARAEPGSVVAARSGPASPRAEAEEQPDPMVPPVPMKYLSQLMKPQEDETGADTSRETVAKAEGTERRAEAGSSLDVLR